ncbi:MAG: hypothetical protein H6708_02235 [Kofleriaceae bacterium]|nr:hypothetical protein [Kofleriaceae bacterium]
MRTLAHLAAPLLIAAALSSCGGKAPPPAAPTPAEEAAVADVERVQAAACACGDDECTVEHVEDVDGVLAHAPPDVHLGDAAAARYGRAVLGAAQCTFVKVQATARQTLADLTALRDRACGCADQACGEATDGALRDAEGRGAEAVVAVDAHDQAQALTDEAHACLDKLGVGPLFAPWPVLDTGGALPGCEAYVRVMEAFARCDKIPRGTREALRQGVDAMVEGIGDQARVPDEVRPQVDAACTQAVDAIRQSAAQTGCTLP